MFCTSTPTTSTESAVSAKTDFNPVTNANPPEPQAPSTLIAGFHCSFSSIKGINPGKLLGLGDDLMWGTADIIVALPDEKKLIVADLKFGKSRVSPKSDQLKIYALGATALVDYEVEQFELIIYQPRLHSGKSHFMTADEMNDFPQQLKQDALATLPENKPQRAAGSACFWCKAKKDCRTLKHKVVEDAFSGIDF